jgi:rubrerythrin
MNAGTQLNLLDALRAEAFAHARYRLYAEQARGNGRGELARLFEETASEGLRHFGELAALSGLVGADERNLEQWREVAEYEVETMYPVFAEHARAAGEAAPATCFEQLRDDARTRRTAFADALAQLRVRS